MKLNGWFHALSNVILQKSLWYPLNRSLSEPPSILDALEKSQIFFLCQEKNYNSAVTHRLVTGMITLSCLTNINYSYKIKFSIILPYQISFKSDLFFFSQIINIKFYFII
jgi:hypothetical protein